jgi:hypothetical protein
MVQYLKFMQVRVLTVEADVQASFAVNNNFKSHIGGFTTIIAMSTKAKDQSEEFSGDGNISKVKRS